MKTALFFPHEGGLAHITRSLAIAMELQKYNFKCVFALPERKQQLVKDAGIEVINVAAYTDHEDTEFAKKFFKKDFLRTIIADELSIINSVKPDVTIVDFRPTARGSCAVSGIPTFFITQSDGLPVLPIVPAVFPTLPGSINRTLSSFFRFIISMVRNFIAKKLEPITKEFAGRKVSYKEVFEKETYLIPEIPDYLPDYCDSNLKKHYVGPIVWSGFTSYVPDWLKELTPDGNTIYLSFGGTGYGKNKLVKLAELLLSKGYRVIVSCGTVADPSDFLPNPKLYVAKYIDGLSACKVADLLVCHGGYGTLMQALVSGIPVVSVPFNPDQIYHSLRIQELKLGICVLNIISLDMLVQIIKMGWLAGVDVGNLVSPNKIVNAVDKVFSNNIFYKTNADTYKTKFDGVDGSVKSAKIIANLITP